MFIRNSLPSRFCVRSLASAFTITTLLSACGGPPEELASPVDEESFMGVVTDELTTHQQQEILAFVNTASLATLDDSVGLDARAAGNIVKYRLGTDGIAGTADDQTFDSMEELDAVPYVGTTAMSKLVLYVLGWDPNAAACDPALVVHGVAEGSDLALSILDLVNTAELPVLDNDVGLDSRAASNIVVARPLACLSQLDAVSYVGAAAFDALADYVTPKFPSRTATSPEQCFVPSGSYFMYHYLDLKPPFLTDGRMTVRHKGHGTYGPVSYALALETAPGVFTNVAVTTPTELSIQEYAFTIPASVLTSAHQATGWLRVRIANPSIGYGGNCVELSLTVDCAACLQCPAGSVDLGIGCQSVSQPYSYSPTGTATSCNNPGTHTFRGVPKATGTATVAFDWAVCDGGTAKVDILANGTWQPVSQLSTTLSCGFASSSVNVASGLLNAAINSKNEVQVRFTYTDQCVAGMGCEYMNDPCMQDLVMTVPR